MNQSEFRTLVAKAEAMAHEQPRRYMLSLACYAALGYLVMVVALVVLIGIVGGAAWVALFSTALFVFILNSNLIFVLVHTQRYALVSLAGANNGINGKNSDGVGHQLNIGHGQNLRVG